MMIARKLRLVAVCVLGLVAMPAAGQPAPAGSQNLPTAVRARALDLARLTAPADLALEADVQGGKKVFFAGFRSDPEGLDLETKNPGIVEALWKAAEPIIRQASIDHQDAYWSDLADIYAARLTAREIEAMNVFYASPTGRKVVAGMYANMNMDPLVAEMANNADWTVPAGAARTAVRDAADKMAAGLSRSEQEAAALLTRTVPEAKLEAVGAEVQALQLKWANKDYPELRDKMDAAMKAGAEQYFKEHPQAD